MEKIFILLVLLCLAIFLAPVALLLTWNLAVCALFPTLPHMGYWVAFGVNIFLNLIGGKFYHSKIDLDD